MTPNLGVFFQNPLVDHIGVYSDTKYNSTTSNCITTVIVSVTIVVEYNCKQDSCYSIYSN